MQPTQSLQDPAVSRVLETARKKLLETGTRNRLIHVNRANQRSNALNLINESTENTFRQLALEKRKMRFKAMGKDKDADEDELLLDDLSDIDGVSDERLTDQFLETPLGPKAQQSRLLKIATQSRIAEEEQGLNILYLAMGFLTWREDKSSATDRQAPLILLPVELVRNARTSTFDIRFRDEEISTNLSLLERLKQDFGIALPEIPEQEDWLPGAYFDQVAETISSRKEWSIDRDGMQLGFFSFSKLLMHRDLDPENWPNNELDGDGLVRGLLIDGFEGGEPLFGPDDRLDTLLDPADILQVVDADASQTKVIEEVRKSASLVVQGPPGTGKSQTITNLIAAAAHDGKTVLFVAEKMAALSVVHSRLVKTGLKDICLELHSRKANKKELSQELGRTLQASLKAISLKDSSQSLRTIRDELNDIAHILHQPIRQGFDTPFEAMATIGHFLGQGLPAPRMSLEGLERISREERRATLEAIARFVQAREKAGDPTAHPFAPVRNLALQPTDVSRAHDELNAAMSALQDLMAAATEKARLLGWREFNASLSGVDTLVKAYEDLASVPETIEEDIDVLFPHLRSLRIREGLEVGARWASRMDEQRSVFSDAAWSLDASRLRPALVKGEGSFLARWFGGYRQASRELASVLRSELPKSPTDRRRLVDGIQEIQRLRQTLAEEEDHLKAALKDVWRGERTPFNQLHGSMQWLARMETTAGLGSADAWRSVLATIDNPIAVAEDLALSSGLTRQVIQAVIDRLQFSVDAFSAQNEAGLERVDLQALKHQFAAMASDMSRYEEWASLCRTIEDARASGAGNLIEVVLNGTVASREAADEFSYACAEASWTLALKSFPDLIRISHRNRHEIVAAFQRLDRGRFEEVRAQVLAAHYARSPKGSVGEMGTIRGEIARKRGHKPIRWLMKNAGSMVQRIKPVFLMSPLSVAQFIPPGSMRFDLLIIDEASQVRPEDALGVVARADQIVVVGDQKQLPPTSFFDRLADGIESDEDDEAELAAASAAEMESILSLCEAKGMRSRMLEWHYRSRDPSLIRVSNAEFYGDNLVLPPSPLELDDDFGLKFKLVPGVYSSKSRGGGRVATNKIEAQAVVRAAADHARNWPDLSLGIVTFSKAQADMMTELLEFARRDDPVLDAFLREGQNEDVFVKNIENVQGDERDVILISVGYGPHEANGRLASMNFGPINGEGGERRLNVLFSRARVRCEVFASFEPRDIDLNKTTKNGPRVLKRFLDYARTGQLEQSTITGLGADSPFEKDVAQVLNDLGYEADLQVGSVGFRIDLGVRNPDHPGQYLLAVECDGATYHSALWARERDRLRQDVLEGLGWTFHRIWSTDWFQRREMEIRRLQKALEDARSNASGKAKIRGANKERPITDTPASVEDEPIVLEELRITVPPYSRSVLHVSSSHEPHEVSMASMMKLVTQVVEHEGPIHTGEVARRIAEAFGKKRVGNRIYDVTLSALREASRASPHIAVAHSDFWITDTQSADVPVRDRSAERGSLVKAEVLPPVEIRAAASLIDKECGQLGQDERVRAVARLLGYQRVGPELQERISRILNA
nr:DUF3320 domain-containing protein [uncultured Cohaesibacter sp.]